MTRFEQNKAKFWQFYRWRCCYFSGQPLDTCNAISYHSMKNFQNGNQILLLKSFYDRKSRGLALKRIFSLVQCLLWIFYHDLNCSHFISLQFHENSQLFHNPHPYSFWKSRTAIQNTRGQKLCVSFFTVQNNCSNLSLFVWCVFKNLTCKNF